MLAMLLSLAAWADDLLDSFAVQQDAYDYQTAVVASCDFPFAYVMFNGTTNEWEVWTPDVEEGARGFIDRARIDFASVSTVNVLAGQMAADCDQGPMYLSATTTASLAASGAGGLDTGSEAASTWYAVWVIRQSGTTNQDVLLSTSSTAPTMPSGYDMRKLVGHVYNNASSNIKRFSMIGKGRVRFVAWDSAYTNSQALAGGTATTYTTVSLDALVPPTTANSVTLRVTTNATSGVRIRWNNANSATYVEVPALQTQTVVVPLVGGGDDIEYLNLVAAGSTDIYVLGYSVEL